MATPLAPTTSTIDPLVVLPLTLVDLSVAPPLALVSLGGEVASSVAQAPSLLRGDAGLPEKVLMEVENITTPLDEAFVVEVILPAERTLGETMEATGLLAKMIGTMSLLEESWVKVLVSICAPESPMEAIFSCPTVSFSSNLLQPSIDTMPEDPNIDAVMPEGLNKATRLLRGLLSLMERQLLEQTFQIFDALGSFI